jgi:hypothetical protein
LEFYSAKKNNDMWFEGKWMQLEDIMLSEVSQAQKDKDHIFSFICARQIRKINIYTKTNVIVYKLICRTFVIVELLYGSRGKREGKENDRASTTW